MSTDAPSSSWPTTLHPAKGMSRECHFRRGRSAAKRSVGSHAQRAVEWRSQWTPVASEGTADLGRAAAAEEVVNGGMLRRIQPPISSASGRLCYRLRRRTRRRRPRSPLLALARQVLDPATVSQQRVTVGGDLDDRVEPQPGSKDQPACPHLLLTSARGCGIRRWVDLEIA